MYLPVIDALECRRASAGERLGFVPDCLDSPMPDPRPIDAITVRGSTTIRELMEMFPDGRALDLMVRLGWPCGHCSARSTEPLSLAAKRHGNPVRAVIACFRSLASGGPSATKLAAARARPRRSPDPARAWLRSAARYARADPGSRDDGTAGDGRTR